MPEWKTAEKLKQPELTEVVGEAPAVIVGEAAIRIDVEATSVVEFEQTNNSGIEPQHTRQSESETQHPPVLLDRPSFPETPPELGDRFDILDFVGSGGMGSVWKVYDKMLGETFAIKVLNADLIADATAVKRFEKEAKLASDLTHANIAAIFGPGADSAGRPYIIMKYVDGESLADIMAREGKLPEERAIDIFTQICEALQHSHMKGVIHRDIKPSNIIISKTESGGDMVHVVDFGIARSIHEEVTKTQALTKAVDVFGSPRYMSPEQLLGKEVTAQSDIYCLGCVFYEMLTGAPPFTDENPVRLILQHLTVPVDIARVPVKLKAIVLSCLAKEPDQRVYSVSMLLDGIRFIDTMPSLNISVNTALHVAALFSIIGMCAMDCSRLNVVPLTSLNLAGLFAFLAFYVRLLNSQNLTNGKDYLLLELNFILCSVSAVLLSLISLFGLPSLTLLSGVLLSGSSSWLLFQPRIFDGWSQLRVFKLTPTVPIAECTRKRLFRVSIWMSLILKIYCVVALGYAASLICDPIVALLNGWGEISTASYFVDQFSLCLFGGILLSMVFAGMDVLEGEGKIQGRFCRRFSQFASMALLMVATLSLVTLVNVDKGFNQFNRQWFMPNSLSTTKVEKGSLEALNYQRSYLADRAKLVAANRLIENYVNPNACHQLADELLSTPAQTDGLNLVYANVVKSKLASFPDDVGYLRQAIKQLEKVSPPALADIEKQVVWHRGNEVVNAAVAIGQRALKCFDLKDAKRASEIANAQYSNPFVSKHWRLEYLERDIAEFEQKYPQLGR